jgi:hypothetical protein
MSFQNCLKLSNFHVYSNKFTKNTSLIWDLYNITDVIFYQEMMIDFMAFENCSSIQNMTIFGNCNISVQSFQYCIALKGITFFGDIEIGSKSFAHCYSLSNITIEGNLTILSNNSDAFDYLSNDINISYYGLKYVQHISFQGHQKLSIYVCSYYYILYPYFGGFSKEVQQLGVCSTSQSLEEYQYSCYLINNWKNRNLENLHPINNINCKNCEKRKSCPLIDKTSIHKMVVSLFL